MTCIRKPSCTPPDSLKSGRTRMGLAGCCSAKAASLGTSDYSGRTSCKLPRNAEKTCTCPARLSAPAEATQNWRSSRLAADYDRAASKPPATQTKNTALAARCFCIVCPRTSLSWRCRARGFTSCREPFESLRRDARCGLSFLPGPCGDASFWNFYGQSLPWLLALDVLISRCSAD